MKDEILNFPRQFSYKPEIHNSGKFKMRREFIVAGMGGSHLAADLLKMWSPEISLIVHSDYNLPSLPKEKLRKTLTIANSYSGNTEETISAFESARKLNLPLIAIATGGKLLGLARKHKTPYIEIPKTNKEPRTAIGTSFVSLLKATGNNARLREARELSSMLEPKTAYAEAKGLVRKISERSLIIYSSERNHALAYIWKISMNETGKIPAFTNVFPELNHNEMNSFSRKIKSAKNSPFYFLVLKSEDDPPRIQKRMSVLENLLQNRNRPVKEINFGHGSNLKDVFQNVMLAMWTSYFTAEEEGVNPDRVAMVEEFKRLLA
ncbi:MAG: hypothetical protein M1312_02560 [Patescibacteria group bacterium]|nr:hypothetical protein [Patescibacteria group bacterium]MDE2144539.1 hypothetical protein [Patescibacteria group bacterium]